MTFNRTLLAWLIGLIVWYLWHSWRASYWAKWLLEIGSRRFPCLPDLVQMVVRILTMLFPLPGEFLPGCCQLLQTVLPSVFLLLQLFLQDGLEDCLPQEYENNPILLDHWRFCCCLAVVGTTRSQKLPMPSWTFWVVLSRLPPKFYWI